MAKPGMVIYGDKELARKLRAMPLKVQKSVLRSAMSKAATPVLQRARQLSPNRSGLLKKSLGKKIKSYKSGTVVVAIGPRMKTIGFVAGKKHVPGRIAHLVEQGHEGPRPAPPHPFLGPAFRSTKSQALDVAQSALAAGVVKEANK